MRYALVDTRDNTVVRVEDKTIDPTEGTKAGFEWWEYQLVESSSATGLRETVSVPGPRTVENGVVRDVTIIRDVTDEEQKETNISTVEKLLSSGLGVMLARLWAPGMTTREFAEHFVEKHGGVS